MRVPDWDHGVEMCNLLTHFISDWIADEDCLVTANGYGNGSAHSYIYFTINNKVTLKVQGSTDENICNSVILRKGDTLKIDMWLNSVNNGLYKIPLVK